MLLCLIMLSSICCLCADQWNAIFMNGEPHIVSVIVAVCYVLFILAATAALSKYGLNTFI